jgi:hypothetical protein
MICTYNYIAMRIVYLYTDSCNAPLKHRHDRAVDDQPFARTPRIHRRNNQRKNKKDA